MTTSNLRSKLNSKNNHICFLAWRSACLPADRVEREERSGFLYDVTAYITCSDRMTQDQNWQHDSGKGWMFFLREFSHNVLA